MEERGRAANNILICSETLREQLQLLAERSKEAHTFELQGLTRAICDVSKALAALWAVGDGQN